MSESIGTPMPEAPKKNNTWLIVGIVAIVLCCCCVGMLAVGWFYGDQILYELGVPLY
jgi:uncharacterized membrane protein